ncbi:FAD/NAD(P)-binding protein [Microbaculum sp. FT89]|uniref:FAD/NAD(P)-binding protein n=1 Tax=Microbaculum sp. FT89 TaxID=3447298 RepID=UPI003F5343FE
MHARAAPLSDPMIPRLFAVRARRDETEDTCTFDLEPRDLELLGGALPLAFAPGQFNMLYLFGLGEVAISISGDPADAGRLVHTVRSVGSVTRGFSRLQPGQTVGVRGPFGTAWPTREAEGRDVLILAGGLGLAPLRPAILRILAERRRYRRVYLFYGTRNPQMLLFRDDLERWRNTPDLAFEITVDHADTTWHGRVGVITKLIAAADFDPDRSTAFLCGPEIMMHFSAEALKARGMRGADIHVSLERNMKCAIGHCGHCQLGPAFICRDGPVFPHDRVAGLLAVQGL